METIRVYADTSVFGGAFDAQFAHATNALFEKVRRGELSLVTSALVKEELIPAPIEVRRFFRKTTRNVEQLRVTEAILALRDAYVNAGIVGIRSHADALHVALAAAHACPVLVSWNCKHIVHFQRIPKYNAVNILCGYGDLAIHTPWELLGDEDSEEDT